MDSYDKKFRDVQDYIPFLSDMIGRLMASKKKDTEADDRLNKMQRLQMILTDKSRRLSLETLKKCEETVKRIKTQIEEKENGAKHSRYLEANHLKRDHHASLDKSKNSRTNNRCDDGPASPSPPRSPLYCSPSSSTSVTKPAERASADQKFVPIEKIDIDEIGPGEWDLDENNPPPKSRKEIVIPKAGDVSSAAKRLSDKLSQRDQDKRDKDWERDRGRDKERIPSQDRRSNHLNLATVDIPSLNGSRRLTSVLEKASSRSEVERLLPPRSQSPLINVPDENLRSPDQDILNSPKSPPRQQSRPRPVSPAKVPAPSLLLRPNTLSEPPLSMDDINELLPESQRQKPSTSSIRPTNRLGLSMSSPSVASPLSETGSSPRLFSADSRIPVDPRTVIDPRVTSDTRAAINSRVPTDPRLVADPRISMDPRTPTDPRVHISQDTRVPTDPRTRPSALPPTDPRIQANVRIADSYERFKRNSTETVTTNDFHNNIVTIPSTQSANVASSYQALHSDYNNTQWQHSVYQPVNTWPTQMIPNMPTMSHIVNGDPNRMVFNQMPRPQLPMQSTLPPYNMAQSQHYTGNYQAPVTRPYEQSFNRPAERFPRPNNFNRPQADSHKDNVNPARDPRDPRSRPETSSTQLKEHQIVNKPPAPKEIHTNKVAKSSDKDVKKKSDQNKTTSHKDKEKDKKDREKSKTTKHSDTKSSKSSSKSNQPLNIYGAVNIPSSGGFSSFKIPKKKPSKDGSSKEGNVSPVTDENVDEDSDKNSNSRRTSADAENSPEIEESITSNDSNLEHILSAVVNARKDGKDKITLGVDDLKSILANVMNKKQSNSKTANASSSDEGSSVSLNKKKKGKQKPSSKHRAIISSSESSDEENKSSNKKLHAKKKSSGSEKISKEKKSKNNPKANPVCENSSIQEESNIDRDESGDKTKQKKNPMRELEALQKDLKASWICDGAMKATGSRTATLKNKNAEIDAEKAKRNLHQHQKPTKNPSTFVSILDSSNSEDDDTPLAQRSESINANSKDQNTSKISPKSAFKRDKKNKTPCDKPTALFPEFQDNSNDSFGLDPSAMDNINEIPSGGSAATKMLDKLINANKRSLKKSKVVDSGDESSSDESYISSTSNLETSSLASKNNDEEVLESAMAEAAQRIRNKGRKNQGRRKKKGSWQTGVISRKRKQKNSQASKTDDVSTESTVDGTVDSGNKTRRSHTSMDENESVQDSEDNEESVHNVDEDITSKVDANALIGYTLGNNDDKYQCLLCSFFRKNIVHHYKYNHPDKEVLISRFSEEAAKLAVKESETLDFKNMDESEKSDENIKYKCRFCPFYTQNYKTGAKEHFYEHITNHTGEYRFHCLKCSRQFVCKATLKNHYSKGCPKRDSSSFVDSTDEDKIPSENRVYGYICTKCNFVQLKKANVDKHVQTWHPSDEKVKVLKINMSLDVKDENSEISCKEEHEEKILIDKIEFDTKDDSLVDPLKSDESELKDDLNNSLASEGLLPQQLKITLQKIDSNTSSPSRNLSAFVCDSEMQNKENEIQLERQKKMKEIAQNIGINVTKDEAQKKLSIIDQLKDKIHTVPQQSESLAEATLIHNNLTELVSVEAEKDIPERSKTPQMILPEEISTDSEKSSEEQIEVKNEPDDTQNSLVDPLDKVAGKSRKRKHDEIKDQEQSNNDVNSNNDANNQESGTKDHMSDTIQRLSAQLQTSNSSPPNKIKKEIEIKDEPKSPPTTAGKHESVANENVENKNDDQPAHFIRLRRIPGDQLSTGAVQGNSETTQNNEQTILGNNQENPGFIKISSVCSLAPSVDNNTETITNIRKVVETSPKTKPGLSLLKKPPQSYYLKRVDGSTPVLTPVGETVKIIPLSIAPTPTTRPIVTIAPTIQPKPDNVLSINGQQAIAIRVDAKGNPITTTTLANISNSANMNLQNQQYKIVKFSNNEQIPVAIKLKSADVYEKMLQDDKLIHLYKCMGKDCCFSTSVEQSFSKHIRLHEEDFNNKLIVDQPKDFYKCAYCYIDCKSYDELLVHLKKVHTYCNYCCKYCFYRAVAFSYVEIHQQNYHPGKNPSIIRLGEDAVHKQPPLQRLDRKQIIKPYVCTHECNKYFFIPEAFVLHLNLHHKNLTSYKCHLCQKYLSSVDLLIEHYKKHGYCKFHCMWCTHGAPTVKELQVHLSLLHYNFPPEILERCLPRDIQKNISAIDQLKVRNLELTPPLTTLESEAAVSSLVSSGQKLSPLQTPKGFTSLANLLPDRSKTGRIQIVDSRSLVSSTQGTSVLLNSKPKSVVAPVDVNEVSNLQTGVVVSSTTVNSATIQIADSDSDIEIIQDCEPASLKTKKEEKVDEVKTENDNPSESETLILDNSKIIEEQSKVPTVQDPKTLDDIKDTGFSGVNLFKCGNKTCEYGGETCNDLKNHLASCGFADQETAWYCKHCGSTSRRFGKPNFFIEHIKVHGLKRFACSLCETRFALQSQATSHMRLKHKYGNCKLVPADPENPIPDGLFTVKAVVSNLISTQTEIMKNPSTKNEPTADEMTTEECEADLVIDEVTKVEEAEDSGKEETTLEPATVLICKHCNQKLNNWRGFTRHVQLMHLKNLQYLCPYCDRSANQESILIQHVRSQHKDKPEYVTKNPNPISDYSAEFWEKEYNVQVPKQRNKKRKRPQSPPEEISIEASLTSAPTSTTTTTTTTTSSSVSERLVCEKCGFEATSSAGLKSHERTHESRIRTRCAYCSFDTFNLSEMRQHWELNHPQRPYVVEEALLPLDSSSSGRSNKRAKVTDERPNIYSCCYCQMSNLSVEGARKHWENSHKDDERCKTFRYAEDGDNEAKCAYCAEPGTKSNLALHIMTYHSEKPFRYVEKEDEGWECQHCKIFLTNKVDITEHQEQKHPEQKMSYKLSVRNFICSQCHIYETSSKEMMRNHIMTHMQLYRCNLCPRSFEKPGWVTAHFKKDHPGADPGTRSLKEEDVQKEIEDMILQSEIHCEPGVRENQVQNPALNKLEKPQASPRVAKKSTTKQCLASSPYRDKIKNVARKSTSNAPRHPQSISYYGSTPIPIDLSTLKTTLSGGFGKMRITCDKLAKLFDINPRLVIKDYFKK